MFVCCVPRNSAEFSRVLHVEQTLFGRLSVPPEMARQFFGIRPEIYVAIIGPDDRVAAYSSAYPLKPEWAEALIAGDIAEADLTPSMLLERDDSLEDSIVYIGSVVVSDHYDPITKLTMLASLASWRMKQLEATAVDRLSVIVTPVSEQGERMVRRARAKILNVGTNRSDGYSICGREITRGYLTSAASKIERCLNGAVVEMIYNFVQSEEPPRGVPVFVGAVHRNRPRSWVAAAINAMMRVKGLASFALHYQGAWKSIASVQPDSLGTCLSLIVMATLALLAIDADLEAEHLSCAYLIPIVLVAIRYGQLNAVVASVACSICAAFVFYEPNFGIFIDDPEDMVELAVFFAMAMMLSHSFTHRPNAIRARRWGDA
jgi:hypothetical protein